MDTSEDLQTVVECLQTTAAQLNAALEDARRLAAEDRVQISRLILLTRRLLEATGLNAEGIERLETTAHFVAEDLAASIQRADAAPSETPGAGADAALRSAVEGAGR